MRGVALTIQGWERRCREFGFTTKTISTLERAHVCTLGAVMCLSEAWANNLRGSVLGEVKEILRVLANDKHDVRYTLRDESISIIRRIWEVFPQPGNTPVGILSFTHSLQPVKISQFIDMRHPTLGSLAFALQKGKHFGMLSRAEHEGIVAFLKKCEAWGN